MTNYGKPHLKQRRCGARWWSWWKASSPSPQPALRDARPIPTRRRSRCNGRVHRHDFLAYPLHTYQASLIQHMFYDFYICVTLKLKDIQRIVEDFGSWNLNDVLSVFSVVVAIRSIHKPGHSPGYCFRLRLCSLRLAHHRHVFSWQRR